MHIAIYQYNSNSCGCRQMIPVNGISGGIRCPNHMSMQNGCVWEVPKKTDVTQDKN